MSTFEEMFGETKAPMSEHQARLEALTAKLGLERFGEAGEPFDPNVHEAVMQAEPDPAQSVPTCAQVLQPGFQVGGLVLRPARVSVAEGGAPSEGPTPTPEEE